MNSNTFSQSQIIAIIFITGFAIQQVLQIIDPVVTWAIAKFKNSQAGRTFRGSVSDGDFKKAVMSSLAFALGAITVGFTHIQLLSYIRPEWGGGVGDFLISALVVGSGTEAINTVLKFFGYLKDSQSPANRLALTQAAKRSPEVNSMIENNPSPCDQPEPVINKPATKEECLIWKGVHVHRRIYCAIADWSKRSVYDLLPTTTLGELVPVWNIGEQVRLVSNTNARRVFGPFDSKMDPPSSLLPSATKLSDWEALVWELQNPKSDCYDLL